MSACFISCHRWEQPVSTHPSALRNVLKALNTWILARTPISGSFMTLLVCKSNIAAPWLKCLMSNAYSETSRHEDCSIRASAAPIAVPSPQYYQRLLVTSLDVDAARWWTGQECSETKNTRLKSHSFLMHTDKLELTANFLTNFVSTVRSVI